MTKWTIISLPACVLLVLGCQDGTQVSHPPDKPAVPNGPGEGVTDSTYAFTTITADPDGDGICYRFDWGDGDTSDWGSWTASGEPGADLHAWLDPGTYQVRAQARDANEDNSTWSSPHEINVMQRRELVLTVSGTRTSGGTVTNFLYRFNHDVTISRFTVEFPTEPGVEHEDVAQRGPKSAGVSYDSQGWNTGGSPMPTGTHYIRVIGTWILGSFDVREAVLVY